MEKAILLHKVPLFSSIKVSELRRYSEKIEVQSFSEGETICQEGCVGGQALYIVAEGQLNILLKDQILTTLQVGNYFGEISLLSEEPHSATIKAVSSGKLYVIKKELFDKIVEKHPEILRWLSKVLGKKLRQTIQISHKTIKSQHVFITISAEKEVGKSVLTANLAASLHKQTNKKVAVVDFYCNPGSCASILKLSPQETILFSTKSHGGSITHADIQRATVPHNLGIDIIFYSKEGEALEFDRGQIKALFEILRETYDAVIVDVPNKLYFEQYKLLVEEADEVIFLAKENSFSLRKSESFIECLKYNFPNLNAKLWVGIVLEKTTPKQKPPIYCRFVYPFDNEAVEQFFKDGIPFVLNKPNSVLSQSINRLAREIGGIRVGLALSAGMAPGLAHIGVLKVLQKEKIPIDLVAGTSGGALFGIPFVANIPFNAVEDAALRIGKLQILSLLDFTMPYSGFIRGKKVIDFVEHFIGNPRFDELLIPFKVVATDFRTGEIFIIDHGPVLEALRASISIPGIFTLFRHGGRYLVDGATSSPVPVDVLYRFGAEKTIAVNVCSDPFGYHERVDNFRNKKTPPHVFDVITQSRAITTHHIAEIETHKADIAICPNVSDFNWRDYHEAPRLIDAGIKAAQEALPRIKELIKS